MDKPTIIPVMEEVPVASTRPVPSGSVRVTKKIERVEKEIDVPVTREELTVERVPVNRVVAEIPRTREEGDEIIVPVVEEEMVVKTQLVLKEEIHIRRRKITDTAKKSVTLASEHVTVEELDAHGAPRERPPSTIDKNP
jgi:uncharacterized protein (TIGR02271 family)